MLLHSPGLLVAMVTTKWSPSNIQIPPFTGECKYGLGILCVNFINKFHVVQKLQYYSPYLQNAPRKSEIM